MRAFSCPRCAQLVFFENSTCLRCGAALAFDPIAREIVLAKSGRPCAGALSIGCTWIVHDDGPWCRSCRLTRTVPNPDDAEAVAELAAVEAAKRRLVFQLDELHLPIGPDLGFDLLSSRFGPVTTGHVDGLITIDLAESDDAHRETLRHQLGEPYRTVLGHLRHEIGHYYWPLLVDRTVEGEAQRLERFRELFGDERADYAQALERHYEAGPPADWATSYVSAYATMHPWEDWAETFAHHLHILDTLQTATEFGLLSTDGLEADGFEAIVAEWLPLSSALNEVNRSMGRDDLYPFVLPPAVVQKLTFVHDLMSQLDHGKPPDRAMA